MKQVEKKHSCCRCADKQKVKLKGNSIIMCVGSIGSGKTHTSELIRKNYKNVIVMSFADELRNMVEPELGLHILMAAANKNKGI